MRPANLTLSPPCNEVKPRYLGPRPPAQAETQAPRSSPPFLPSAQNGTQVFKCPLSSHSGIQVFGSSIPPRVEPRHQGVPPPM